MQKIFIKIIDCGRYNITLPVIKLPSTTLTRKERQLFIRLARCATTTSSRVWSTTQGAGLVAILLLMMVITVARDGDDDEDGDHVLLS